MTRDHFLFLVIGALTGFIAGYVMHEQMAARQSPPAWGGQAVTSQPAGVRPAQPAGRGAPGAQQGTAPGAAANPAMAGMEQVQQLRAYVEANPEDARAVRQLADLNYDIANWSRAAELYERFLTLEPDSVDAMTDLGACYRNQGEPARALEIFRQVKTLAPEHWQARYNEVLILAFDLRDFEAARAELEVLRRLQPSNANITRLAAEVEKLENA